VQVQAHTCAKLEVCVLGCSVICGPFPRACMYVSFSLSRSLCDCAYACVYVLFVCVRERKRVSTHARAR